MKEICEHLKYTPVDDPGLLNRFRLEEGQLLIKNDYTCQSKDREGDICPQVVANFEKEGLGFLDIKEMEQCPHYSISE